MNDRRDGQSRDRQARDGLARDGRPLAQPGYRREALPDPEAVGEDEALAAAIRTEIEAGGPITFAQFMERALYEPGHGYYRRPDAGPGRTGDFLTAPEAHPIFGAAIGRLLEQAWDAMGRPDPFIVTEPGAGTGALAAGLLGGLRDQGSPLLAAIRYRPVEVEAARGEAFRERLAAEGLAGHLEADDPPATPAEAGAVVANEVLDALPVHRVVGRADGIRELLVGVTGDGGFEAVEGDPTTPALAERLAAEEVSLSEGQVTEVCLAVDGWLAGAVRHLEAGIVVLVDYAEEPATLHGPGRPNGTLRAFARHAVGGGPVPACRAPGPHRDRGSRRGAGSSGEGRAETPRRDHPGRAAGGRRHPRADRRLAPTAGRGAAGRAPAPLGAHAPDGHSRHGWVQGAGVRARAAA